MAVIKFVSVPLTMQSTADMEQELLTRARTASFRKQVSCLKEVKCFSL